MTASSPVTPKPTFATVEEFLAWAGAQPDIRYELVDGEAVMMAGGSRSHARISGNLSAWLLAQLRGGPCEPFGSDFGVVLPGVRVILRYPDASVSCTEEGEDALRAPAVAPPRRRGPGPGPSEATSIQPPSGDGRPARKRRHPRERSDTAR